MSLQIGMTGFETDSVNPYSDNDLQIPAEPAPHKIPHVGICDPRLERIIELWDSLPEDAKDFIFLSVTREVIR